MITPHEAESLRAAVQLMRDHQRAYFKGDRSQERLNASKAAERRVDTLLRELDDAERTAAQPSLFGGRR